MDPASLLMLVQPPCDIAAVSKPIYGNEISYHYKKHKICRFDDGLMAYFIGIRPLTQDPAFYRTWAFSNNPLFPICCNFGLAFFLEIGFYLEGRPQKERLKNLFSSLKKSVCVLKESYFFFAVFFAAFFAGAFFAAIICSPPFFHFTAWKIIL